MSKEALKMALEALEGIYKVEWTNKVLEESNG